MEKKLLATKESRSLNGEKTSVSLFQPLDNPNSFPLYEAIVTATTKDKEAVAIRIDGLHFNCPDMGDHVVDIMDSEDADFGEIAWQMFENNKVIRTPLPVGHIFGCWNVRLLSGNEQAFSQDPSMLEDAIEKTLALFRDTILAEDKNPLYFVFYGRLGYRTGSHDFTDYETDDYFADRSSLVPYAAMHRFVSNNGEQVCLFNDNLLYNLFLKTNLTVFRCTGGLCAGKENYLAVHDAACIGNEEKKKRQIQIPVLSPRRERRSDWF